MMRLNSRGVVLNENAHAHTQLLLKQAAPFYAAPDFERGKV